MGSDLSKGASTLRNSERDTFRGVLEEPMLPIVSVHGTEVLADLGLL